MNDGLLGTAVEMDALRRCVDEWIDAELRPSPVFLGVERVEADKWRLRVSGEEREVITIWWWLREYTLWSEAYFLPAPANDGTELYEALLRWNASLYGCAFAIGEEDAVYLRGRCPWRAVSRNELGRLFGSIYEAIERYFPYALGLAGYGKPAGSGS